MNTRVYNNTDWRVRVRCVSNSKWKMCFANDRRNKKKIKRCDIRCPHIAIWLLILYTGCWPVYTYWIHYKIDWLVFTINIVRAFKIYCYRHATNAIYFIWVFLWVSAYKTGRPNTFAAILYLSSTISLHSIPLLWHHFLHDLPVFGVVYLTVFFQSHLP